VPHPLYFVPEEKIRKTVGVYQSTEPPRKRPATVLLVVVAVLIAVALIAYLMIRMR
jgi:hypothetical protein